MSTSALRRQMAHKPVPMPVQVPKVALLWLCRLRSHLPQARLVAIPGIRLARAVAGVAGVAAVVGVARCARSQYTPMAIP